MENNSRDILENLSGKFIRDNNLSVQISAELEFYLSDGNKESDHHCLALILLGCRNSAIPIHRIENETGFRQYEIALGRFSDPVEMSDNIIKLKDIISKSAEKFGSMAIFKAKPYNNQPGCGLHIHISLHKDGRNLFQKKNEDDESDELLYSIGGLCKTMPEAMIYFAPNESSYKRYSAEFNQDIPEDLPLRKYNNAPINVSWGGNNRTTAIRIPTSTLIKEDRHIEHRVPGIDADPYLASAAIIAGIQHGLTNKIFTAPPKLYGDAFNRQYNLSPLPRTLKEARKYASESNIINKLLFS